MEWTKLVSFLERQKLTIQINFKEFTIITRFTEWEIILGRE